jgi:hypothetical protein
MATKKPMKKFKRYDEGGSVEESSAKKRGLEISNKEEPVGFFERLRMGNIDQPGSEAYNRFGAGRAYAKTMEDEGEAMRAAQRAPSAPAAPAPSARPLSDDMYSDYGSSEGRSSSETIRPTRPAASKPTVPAKPAATKLTPESFSVPRLIDRTKPVGTGNQRGPTAEELADYAAKKNQKPAASAASQIPGQSAKAPQGEKIDSSEMSRNIENAMLATGAGGVGVAGLYKLGKMLKGGREAAGKVAPYLKELGTSAPKKLLEGPRKLLEGPRKSTKTSDVTDVTPKKVSYRSETNPTKREDARADEAREKLMNSKFVKKPKKSLDESDTTGGAVGYKRGGKIMKYASGGMVGSASKRADGIATKGKTRCKIY